MANETSMADSMESLGEENLQDIAGGKGFGFTKKCTDSYDSPLVYHRCRLIHVDTTAEDPDPNRKACQYECVDCKKVLTIWVHYKDEIRQRVRILEGTIGKDDGVIRGTW